MDTPERGDVWLAVPAAKFLRRLGALTPVQMEETETVIRGWLGLAR